jgi:hypothetical protein
VINSLYINVVLLVVVGENINHGESAVVFRIYLDS